MRFWISGTCLFILIFFCLSLFNGVTRGQVSPKGKIVGGKPVRLERYPSAVLFYNLGAQCAGSILNSWTVLTAAHCFDINKDKDNMLIEVGARHLYDLNSQSHEVIYFITHENYNKTALFSCDIALLFLKKPIQFNDKVKKGLLVDSNKWMNKGERNFNAIGWGWTEYGGSLSEDGLLMTELEFVKTKDCGRMHKLNLSADMFCLYGNGTKDTCRGDSGGGIWWREMIVGITSHGDGCAQKNKPSVYANVWYFRKWIEQNVEYFYNTYCNETDDSGSN